MANEFDALFKGLDNLVKTKTVIGEPIRIDNAVIVPIMEVSMGMASGSFNQGNSNAGAMSARMTPVSLFVMQNGSSRMIQISNTDAVSKAIDMIPDFINKISSKKVSKDIVAKAKKIAETSESTTELG